MGEDTDADYPGWWDSGHWYQSTAGRTLILFDFVLTLVLVYWTIDGPWLGTANSMFAIHDVPVGMIPETVYVVSVLGALGFIFTALIDSFHRTTGELIEFNVRLLAALPLGAGVFLLGDVLLPAADGTGPLLLGLVFLAGLYVNLTYNQLGALAKRLLARDRSAASGRS